MDNPVDGRFVIADNPLLLGMRRHQRVEVAAGLTVTAGVSRVWVKGVRKGNGITVCRVIAAAAAGEVHFQVDGGPHLKTYLPGRLLVKNSEGVEFLVFADECRVIGGRRASAAGTRRLRALIGDLYR